MLVFLGIQTLNHLDGRQIIIIISKKVDYKMED